jgi:predicted ATPase
MLRVQDLLERLEKGEDEQTEFRQYFSRDSDILPSIVALANGPKEGWLVFGVDETGGIVGVLDAGGLVRRLSGLCREACEPSLSPDLEIIKIDDASRVVVLQILGVEQEKPYREKERGTHWLRRGSRNQSVTYEEAARSVEERHRVWFPILRTLVAKRFRSLYDVCLPLKPLNIIIGPNASGKSNFFKLLQFVYDVVGRGTWEPYDETGNHMFWYGTEDQAEKRISQFEVHLEIELPEQYGRFVPFYLMVSQLDQARLHLSQETVKLKLDATDRESVDFVSRDRERVEHYVKQNGEYEAIDTVLPMRTAALREYGRNAQFLPLAALYRFIDGWRLFDVDVKAARQSAVSAQSPKSIPQLDSDAGNLSAFLQALAHHSPEVLEEIQDRLERAIGFPKALETVYRPSLSGGPGRTSIIFREDAFPDVPIPSESISDGTIRLLAHLAALLGDPAASLICIEEPTHGLHPHLVLRLADAVRSVVDVEPNDAEDVRRPQVFFTTHSPDFLDCFDLEGEADYLQVFIAGRDLKSGKTTFRPVNAKELAHWLDDYRLGELVRMGLVR